MRQPYTFSAWDVVVRELQAKRDEFAEQTSSPLAQSYYAYAKRIDALLRSVQVEWRSEMDGDL